jgi:Putative transmembrane protein (PGPGW)
MTTSTLPEPPPTVENAQDIEDVQDLENAEPEAPPGLEAPAYPRRPLPLWVRIAVLTVGWLVLLVGVAGLVLPGIQGVATILAGLAILSISSELAHRWMRRALQRWPKLSGRVERFRTRMQSWLHRMVEKRS